MSASLANLQRRLIDQGLEKTKALPAAAAANFTDSLDLGSARLGPAADFMELEVFTEATPSLVDDKTITLTVKDSADGSNFAPVTSLATVVRTGAGGAGAGAFSQRFRLPNLTRRFLRVDAAVLTAGGDNTAKNYGLRVLALA